LFSSYRFYDSIFREVCCISCCSLIWRCRIISFAKEIAGFVPGGGLAMMTGRKAYQIVKKSKF
jgi:hypothetical protein